MIKLVDDTNKEFLKYAAKIDEKLGLVVKRYKTLQAGAKAMAKKQDLRLYQQLMGIPKEIETLIEECTQENLDFGSSWFELRGVNWTGVGYDLPAEFNKGFYEARFKLMGEAKTITGKVAKMEGLLKEATIAMNDIRSLFGGEGEQDQGMIDDDAQDLHDRVAKQLKKFEDAVRYEPGVKRMRNVFKENPDQVDTGLQANIRSRMQDAIATNKEIKTSQSAYTKELQQLGKIAKSPTPKAQKLMVLTAGMIKDFTPAETAASEWAKAYAELWKEADAIIKKNAKGKK